MRKVISIIIVMVVCLVGNSLNVNAEEDEYIFRLRN